jgi:hypothetical protein
MVVLLLLARLSASHLPHLARHAAALARRRQLPAWTNS